MLCLCVFLKVCVFFVLCYVEVFRVRACIVLRVSCCVVVVNHAVFQ